MNSCAFPIAIAASLAWLSMAQVAADLYVSPGGNDENPGTQDRPFATLSRARQAAREVKQEAGLPPSGLTIWLAGGTYELRQTFELDQHDSGTKESRVTYRVKPGAPVRISGGRAIQPQAFAPVSEEAALRRLDANVRAKVLQCDLGDAGIADLGELNRSALRGGPMLELFVNGRTMPLARWPNEGWAKYGKVLDAGSVPRWKEKPDRPGTLEYTGARPERWAEAKAIWLHGYYAFDWYDDVLKVKTLDTETKRITFTTPHMYGLKSNRRYAALNLIEEIDEPGEWVLDREAGRLYLYPPGDMKDATIVVSVLDQPLFKLTRASHITIRDLTFEYGRAKAIEMAGGVENLIAGCTIRNLGTSAITIGPAESRRDGALRLETGDPVVDGRRNRVVGCDIYNVGTSGISLNGGDRRTLAPAGHEAVNNDIHHYSRRKRTNCPAIGLSGVGNRAAHNFIHDAPHTGLWHSGNDHVIELNEACRLCWETGDVGVFYSGRNWTFRGNVVRHNFIHHIDAPGHVGSMAVYLDDSHSSTRIYGNVFYKTDYAAFIGGGRDNVVENNVFVECKRSMHLDNRSQGWAHKYQKPGGDHRMYGKLEDVRHDQPPYSTRYPELASILDENPHEPRGNKVLRNVCVRGNWLHVFKGAEKILDLQDNLVTKDDPGFVSVAEMDFALKPDSEVVRKIPGFEPIPFDTIGLRMAEYRTKLPARAPRIVPDGGAFAEPMRVALQSTRSDVSIRYTLDGSEPTPTSPIYTEPFVLEQTVTVKAAAFTEDAAAMPSATTEARFVRLEFGEGKGVYLSDLEPAEVLSHGGLKKDVNYRRNDFITLSGNACRKGILIHAKKTGEGSSAHVIYDLDGALRVATRFKALIGIDAAADARGSVSFRVEVNRAGRWETLYQSPVLRGGSKAEQRSVDVDIRGARRLRLSADGGRNIECDHAAWGAARLE